MKLATQDMIPKIDSFAESELGLSTVTLMGRSGEAVARAAAGLAPEGGKILILAGRGNNGGDGYAAAVSLAPRYRVTVYDVFSAGQRSEAGKHWLAMAQRSGAKIIPMTDLATVESEIMSADLVVDAIFGTGLSGEVPDRVVSLAAAIGRSEAKKLAVDIPLGINGDSGTAASYAYKSDVTVALSYPKAGLYSYPARSFVGDVVCDSLGIDDCEVSRKFVFNRFFTDKEEAKRLLPHRPINSNKATYGRVLLLVGSDEYRGAAHLALEAALRGGTGYVTYMGEEELCRELRMKFPEALYSTHCDKQSVVSASADKSAVLLGSGSGTSEEVCRLAEALLSEEGAPLILDADAINSIARFGSLSDIKRSRRPVILTPHPLEFSRISGIDTEYINAHRLEVAERFARELGCILLLKGAATVITDGTHTYINGSGNTALAKAGSGDVLAGLTAALCASSYAGGARSTEELLGSVALAAYIHGRAGDTLSAELSEFGVTPSDLPLACARAIAEL